MELNSDYVSDILEEIALEGLDGITLQGIRRHIALERTKQRTEM